MFNAKLYKLYLATARAAALHGNKGEMDRALDEASKVGIVTTARIKRIHALYEQTVRNVQSGRDAVLQAQRTPGTEEYDEQLAHAENIALVVGILSERMAATEHAQWQVRPTKRVPHRYEEFGGFAGWYAYGAFAGYIYSVVEREHASTDEWLENTMDYGTRVFRATLQAQRPLVKEDLEMLAHSSTF